MIKTQAGFKFSDYEYRQLRFPFGVLDFEYITFKFLTHITQEELRIDRGKRFDFALVVENYLTHRRYVAFKRTDVPDLTIKDAAIRKRK